jgi:hypothetical protein
MKIRRKLSLVCVAVLVVSLFTIVVSATSYGPLGTLTLSRGDGYKYSTSIYDTKGYSSEGTYYINVTDMTMITNPTAKIVNSNGEQRSFTVSLNGPAVYSNSLYSSATVGCTYYMAAKPGNLQIGSDTITAQINVG